ncbi:hypothetical protein N7520_001469 [Penicillium odoratum]|uniref:uncharacterized protein n=1 Tax=Penicillium odoratum TaxID=1167516 RepID=UPI002549AC88|nr:uncharacterized protein N7520_001469 [Penicillium odoratum]KAJ5778223.1 hypothetical protein N7520_001469 [Penicillium odoratum]
MDQIILSFNELNLNETQIGLQNEKAPYQEQIAPADTIAMHPIGLVDNTNLSSPSSSSPPKPSSTSSTSHTEGSPSPSSHKLTTLLNTLLTESEYLTHLNLCRVRQIARSTEKAAALVGKFLYSNKCFQHELEAAFLGPYRDAQRGRTAPLNMLVPIHGWPGDEPDVITGAILDNCPECFEWICRRLPTMDCYGCNLFGWSYVAIAVYARSVDILEYLFAWNEPVGSMERMMCIRANAFQMSATPTPLSFAAWRGDVWFLEFLLDFWRPHESGRLESKTLNGLSSVDKYYFCTFATKDVAVQLARVGLPIHNTVLPDLDRPLVSLTRSATSWHAAVFNGPIFLNSLERNSNVSKFALDANGESPLHFAMRARRVDSIAWLTKHGGSPWTSSPSE